MSALSKIASLITAENVSILLFFVGLLGLVMRKNMMITVMAIGIMNAAIILFFITMNAAPEQVPPMAAETVGAAADPVPQALMITSVVIGVSVTAIMLVLTLDYYRQHGNLDWKVAQLLAAGRDATTVAPGPVAPVDLRELLRANMARIRTLAR